MVRMNAADTAANPAVARLRLVESGEGYVDLAIPGTSYKLRLRPTGPITVEPGKRIKGIIRADVWKLDHVSGGGGSYIEPVYGKPRRVQGPVLGATPEGNGLIVNVHGCPIVGELPERWKASEIGRSFRVGLDVTGVPTFEPTV